VARKVPDDWACFIRLYKWCVDVSPITCGGLGHSLQPVSTVIWNDCWPLPCSSSGFWQIYESRTTTTLY